MVNPPGRGGRLDGKVVRIVKKVSKKLLGTFGERFGRPLLRPVRIGLGRGNPARFPGEIFPRRRRYRLRRPGRDEDRRGPRQARRSGRRCSDHHPQIRAGRRSFRKRSRPKRKRSPRPLPAKDYPGRVDYREWRSFTIDGETAQDFDDAVSISRRGNGGFRLGVHIADVSEYVRPGSALDAEAYRPGDKRLFPRPDPAHAPGAALQQRLLAPAARRPPDRVRCLRFRQGRRADRFGLPSVGHPDGRADDLRLRSSRSWRTTRPRGRLFRTSFRDLLDLHELAKKLRRRRMAGGSLDFDLVEPELVYQEGKVASIEVFAPNEAHKLIEEFMVTANVAVAEYLRLRGVPSLHRFHDNPDPDRLNELRETLAFFHILLPSGRISSRDLQAAIRAAEGTPIEKFVNIRILRSLRLAEYSAEQSGHYGLGLKDYTHFTSPIRRYPDLVIHRLLKADLAGRETAESRPGSHGPPFVRAGAQVRGRRKRPRRMADLPVPQRAAGRRRVRDDHRYVPKRVNRRAERFLRLGDAGFRRPGRGLFRQALARRPDRKADGPAVRAGPEPQGPDRLRRPASPPDEPGFAGGGNPGESFPQAPVVLISSGRSESPPGLVCLYGRKPVQ